jgi:hypothetical protein
LRRRKIQALKLLITTIFMAVLILPVFAESGNKGIRNSKKTTEATVLMGMVVEQSTGEALPGAQVKINGYDKGVCSDLDGNFEVHDIQSGTYNPEISFVLSSKLFSLCGNQFR